MNQSIYTERENILPHHAEWLDGCGATWVMGEKFNEWMSDISNQICFTNVNNSYKFNCWGVNGSTHIPTGTEFCERVAEILGLPKPTFEPNIVNLPPNTEQKMLWPSHRAYRILDSLDGIPLDTRFKLSEWIPPFGKGNEIMWVINGTSVAYGYLQKIEFNGWCLICKDFADDGEYENMISMSLNTEWMRIV